MFNEELVVEVVTWLEKAAAKSNHLAVGKKLDGLKTTSDGWMVSYARLEKEGVVEVIFDMPVNRIAAHVGLNDAEVGAMKELLAAVPEDGVIAVDLYMRGEGEKKEEVVRLRRQHYVPKERRDDIRDTQSKIALMILAVNDKEPGNEERQRVWKDAMKLTDHFGNS